ncbi:CTSB [Cordylochernes scorpioides]|uniref:CTSB n=1 Tax=Cordylochernes scorpioides TaxID=51811 RepID=A0ABY6K0M2_9ARAC|nr:CTSB [Cordylochernes scorpioides]
MPEDPALQVRGPLDDGEGLHDDWPDPPTGPVAAGDTNMSQLPLEHLQAKFGALLDNKYNLPLKMHDIEKMEIPENFDSREKWSNCQSIHQVRDQSECGSCWAMGAVSAMSDRICIASEGRVQVSISAEDLLSCCKTCGHGCDGGYPQDAWDYWVNHGLVTGGEYESGEGCKPYPFPPCEHHTEGPRPQCGDIRPTPKCRHMCRKGYDTTYRHDKIYGKSAYSLPDDEKQIQMEILKNGPVEASFRVYDDFLVYKNGVYQTHLSTPSKFGHAIKILGWGTENGTPYWLCANSWNSDWGENGKKTRNLTIFNPLNHIIEYKIVIKYKNMNIKQ